MHSPSTEAGTGARRDPRSLAAEGWTRQSVAGEPRLSEIVELHRSLGHEVLLVPVLQAIAEDRDAYACTACFADDGAADGVMVVYSRPSTDAAAWEDERS